MAAALKPFNQAAGVIADPAGLAAVLASYPLTTEAKVVSGGASLVTLEVVLTPYPELAATGYPTEVVLISVWRDGRIIAVPKADDRSWHHRNRSIFRELCLWYSEDPRPLRWEWPDGLLAYLVIVHRHVQAEEYARRNDGRWPVEDAPHGTPAVGGRHPIRTTSMRLMAGRKS